MKLSLPLLSAGLFFATGANATLEAAWNIDEPTITANGPVFTQVYTGITQGEDRMKMQFYGPNCKDPDQAEGFQQYGTLMGGTESGFGDGYFSDATVIVTAGTASLWYTVNSEAMTDAVYSTGIGITSPIFNAGTSATPTDTNIFCIRFGLTTSGGAQEINFNEAVVTMTISMDGSFTVAGVNVAPKDKSAAATTQNYSANAYLCNQDTGADTTDQNTLTSPFKQGEPITICVVAQELDESDNTNGPTTVVEIAGLTLFDWTLDGSSPILSQPAFPDPTTNGLGLSQQLGNGNGYLGSSATAGFMFQSILFAGFYAQVGVVTGAGTADLQFITRRRLGEDQQDERALQDNIASAVGVSAPVTAETDGPAPLQTAGGAIVSMASTVIGIAGLISAILLA